MIILNRTIFLIFFLGITTFAREDFFYSFIDENSEQISQERKDAISDGLKILRNIKNLLKKGEVKEASAQLESFKSRSDIDILRSNMIILESEIGLRLNTKTDLQRSDTLLEEAINRSYINEEDLPKAYMLLIELKMAANKDEEARYFVNVLLNNFNAEIVKAYGTVYLSKLHTKQKEYQRAIAILYKVLAQTQNIDVATVIAYELFDVYILDEQKDEAYALMQSVIDVNVDYYSNNVRLVMDKVERLRKNMMYDLTVKTLENTINRATNIEVLSDLKFELAQTYMLMYKKGDNQILLDAQELYSQVLSDFPNGENSDEAKMIIDEILMRSKKISPSIVSIKYPNSMLMMEKALLQEILNHIDNKEYQTIIKSQKIYTKISKDTFSRFGYNNLDEILDKAKLLMLEESIATKNCEELDIILNDTMSSALENIIYNPLLQASYFECLIENPKEKHYDLTKEALFDSRDAQAYLQLEELALILANYTDAFELSNRIKMLDDEEFLQREFLFRFQTINAMENTVEMQRFFMYASNNPDYIEANEDNPVIIDFYYQYYYYLLDENRNEEALEILQKLYDKQNEYKINIYSPAIERELANYEKENENYERALEYLQGGLNNTRNIKNNELAEVYYDMIKIYELTNNTSLYDETLQKCKDLDPATTTTLYKKLCDEM